MTQGKTKPPAALKDGGIIKLMETEGIGTSATRDGMIEKLRARDYCAMDAKGVVTPTPLGRALITMVRAAAPDLADTAPSARLEAEMKAVGEGAAAPAEVEARVIAHARDVVGQLKKARLPLLPAPRPAEARGPARGRGKGTGRRKAAVGSRRR